MASVVLAVLLSACGGRSVMVRRPADPQVDAAVTAMWTGEIERVARDGDWILSRSYALVGDVIASATAGEDLSHASIYDADRHAVIESVREGIREIPLADLVARNHYLIVVRPANMTADDQHDAVARARTKLGGKFDVTGMFGIDAADRFYCSELVYWASQTEARSGHRERVVTPADLMKYGQVIYWSGKRDDAQIMALAAAQP